MISGYALASRQSASTIHTMLRFGAMLLSLLLPCAVFAQASERQGVSFRASYNTYAAGMPVAQVETSLTFSPQTYRVNVGYRTTGMVGLFFRGHQSDLASGSWRGLAAKPSRFVGEGSWRGANRLANIEYEDGRPMIRQLVPPNDGEREPVPDALKINTIDALSALAELIRVVDLTGRCETVARVYDGRRAVEIEAHTAGEETLDPTSRSSFSGNALRCDFSGRMQAGFLFGDDRQRDSKPMHGSAWLAPVAAGLRLPVRLAFETRWFGDATMYLTEVAPGSDVKMAQGN
jgi:hypothetical protein